MSAPADDLARDPGLQPERTELAWRRTALAIAVGSLVSLRLLPAALGSVWWVLVGVAGLGVAAWLWLASRGRYRSFGRTMDAGAHAPDGRLPFALVALTMLTGFVALGIVVVSSA